MALIENHGIVYRVGMDAAAIQEMADCLMVSARFDMAFDLLSRTVYQHNPAEAQRKIQESMERFNQQVQQFQRQAKPPMEQPPVAQPPEPAAGFESVMDEAAAPTENEPSCGVTMECSNSN